MIPNIIPPGDRENTVLRYALLDPNFKKERRLSNRWPFVKGIACQTSSLADSARTYHRRTDWYQSFEEADLGVGVYRTMALTMTAVGMGCKEVERRDRL